MEPKERAKELLERVQKLKKQLPSSQATTMVENLIAEVSSSVSKQIADGPIMDKLKELSLGLENVKNIDLTGITKSLQDAEERNNNSFTEYGARVTERIDSLISKIRDSETNGFAALTKSTGTLLNEINALQNEFSQEKAASTNRSSLIEAEVSRVTQTLATAAKSYVTNEFFSKAQSESSVSQETALQALRITITELEKNLNSRIAGLQNNHGGNMNRNIAISGNTSVLSRYTDINLKPGNGTTITYAYNDQTKYTDITITSSGSGGSGITRQIQTVIIPTLMDATVNIDQVYLVAGTVTMTLPTSVGNKNMYTVKNIGAGVVTIITTGGETIDGSVNITMPVQYTSVDLISNNAGNWNIT